MKQFFPITPNWQYFMYAYAIFVAGFFFLTRSKYHNLFYYFVLLTPYIAVFGSNRIRPIFQSTIFMFTAVYLLMVAVSILWGAPPEPLKLSKYMLHFLYLIAFITLTIELSLHRQDFLDKILKTFLLSAAFWAPVSIILFYQDAQWNERLFGVGRLTNPVSGSTIYGMVALICFHITVQGDAFSVKWQRFAFFVGILCIVYIVLTQSRGPVIGLFLALLLYSSYSHYWKITLTLIVTATALALLLFLDIIPSELVLSRGLSSRPEIWKIAFTYIMDNPWFGSGENFGVAYKVSERMTIYKHTHNTYVCSLLYVGIAGTSLLITLIAQSFRYAYTMTDKLVFSLLVYAIIIQFINGYKLLNNPEIGWLYFWFPIALAAAGEIRAKHTSVCTNNSNQVESAQ